ncbi:MAG: GtrA family protein [Patescibacteria group bacterium]
MKAIDVVLALIFGRIIGFLLGDFLREWEIHINLYLNLIIWIAFPLISLFCLWLAHLIGRKFLFIYQGAKFFLVGAVATVVDLKLFEFIWLLVLAQIQASSIIAKGFSFVISTALKYWGNKYWAFQKHGKENIHKEMAQFFLITLIGLAVDILSFRYFVNALGPQFDIPAAIWIKLSVIFAAIIAAIWNFIGYKFFVFKK